MSYTVIAQNLALWEKDSSTRTLDFKGTTRTIEFAELRPDKIEDVYVKNTGHQSKATLRIDRVET